MKTITTRLLAFAVFALAATTTEGADFNGDGKQDLLWRNHFGSPVVWQMNGLGVASRYTLAIAPDSGSSIVGSGDFFGTSPGGILWVDSTNQLSIWRVNNGDVQQTCVVASSIDPGWSYLGVGDVNSDGIDDVVWRAPDDSVRIYLMNGCNTPQTVVLAGTANVDWTFLGTGGGDAHSDGAIFWRDGSGDIVLWRLHNGTSILTTSLPAGTYASWTVGAVADFDGDGTADILWRSGTQTALWLMNGTKATAVAVTAASSSVFAAADSVFGSGFDAPSQSAPPLTAAWTILGTSDVNSDGRADVVLADTHGNAAIWQMQGATVQATALISATADMPYTALTGWRMAMDRPVITKINNQVAVAWKPVSGSPTYTVYASATNFPATSGVPIAAAGTTLSFGRDAAGYADKRYFALSAGYLGVQLPPSPEAYMVEFNATRLPIWGALAIADLNGDGCSDILGGLGDCHGNFVPQAYSNGLSAMIAPGRAYRDARFADFNGDGILDAIANTYACDVPECGGNDTDSKILLFFGNGNGTFTLDTSFTALNVPGGGFGETIVVADLNNDGYLDIYLPKYTSYDPSEHNFLLLNDGSGHFTDVADIAGVAMRNIPLCGRPEGAQAIDLNLDGRIDLYAGSHLFLNNGVNTNGVPLFSDLGGTIDNACNAITPSPAGLPLMMDEGAKFIDLDNSGRLSLALNAETVPPTIHVFKFDGVAHFTDVDVIPDIFLSDAWGFNAADVDGDGLPDLVVAGGCDPGFFSGGEIDPSCTTFGNPHALPQLLVNRGGNFVRHDFYDDGLLSTTRGWHDLLTYADFDLSGTMDFIARASGGSDTGLYAVMNRATSAATLLVTVVGANEEQNQAGRVVHVIPVLRPNVVMTQVVDSGSGYMSNGPYDLTFATPYDGTYSISVRFANAAYTATARAGDHITMRANGTYYLQ